MVIEVRQGSIPIPPGMENETLKFFLDWCVKNKTDCFFSAGKARLVMIHVSEHIGENQNAVDRIFGDVFENDNSPQY
jgi:hypothetical protein